MAKLPKIQSSIFSLELPSTGKKVRYKLFTVREEKILLTAMQSDDEATILDAIEQIIRNCIVDTDFKFESMTLFDIEYFLIQLRAKSVNNVIEVKVLDKTDKKYYGVTVNLDEIQVVKPEKIKDTIVLNDEVTIKMKYPTFTEMRDIEDGDYKLIDTLGKCIKTVVNGEDVMELKDFSQEEIRDFIMSFSAKNIKEIEEFFKNLPKVSHTVTYVTDDQEVRKMEVSGIRNFFLS